MLNTANLYEVTLDHDTLAEARDVLKRGFCLRHMILDCAKLGRIQAEAGNVQRAEEYAGEISALQDLEYREYRESPGYQMDNLLPSESGEPHPQRLTLAAYFNRLMRAYLVTRSPLPWVTYRVGELEPNPAFIAEDELAEQESAA